MRAHRRAAELLAIREDSAERVAEHLLATEPAGDAWTVARLTEAAREAARRGAPESAVSYLRRVLAEPPPPGARPQVLLDLGVAEATAGQPQGEVHLREALETAGDDDVRLGAALVLAHVLGRDERIARGDRGHRPRGREARRRARSRARAAGVDGDGRGDARCRDGAPPGLAHAGHAPRRRPRARAARGPGRGRARRRPRQRARRRPASRSRSGRSPPARGSCPSRPTCPGSRRPRSRSSGPTRTPRRRSPLDAGVAESRATGDPALFGMSLSQRAWLLLRLGDLQGAEGDARTVLEAADLAAPELYRKLAAAILVNASIEQGELDQAQSVLDGFGLDESARTQTSAVLRLARGRLRLAQERPDRGPRRHPHRGPHRVRHRVDMSGLPGLALERGARPPRPGRARGRPAPGHGGGRAGARLRWRCARSGSSLRDGRRGGGRHGGRGPAAREPGLPGAARGSRSSARGRWPSWGCWSARPAGARRRA